MAEPEITLRPGTNVFEVLKRYQVWPRVKPEKVPCYLAVTLTVLEMTAPGDLRQEP